MLYFCSVFELFLALKARDSGGQPHYGIKKRKICFGVVAFGRCSWVVKREVGGKGIKTL